MLQFLKKIHQKNVVLFYAGLLCGLLFVICLSSAYQGNITEKNGDFFSASCKYALSFWIFFWTISIMLNHLNDRFRRKLISILLSFVLIGILLCKMVVEDGFFMDYAPQINNVYEFLNVFYVIFYLLMIWMVFLFFRQRKNPRSQHFTWGIRMSLLLFTISITLGFVMLYLDTHTIGGIDGSAGIPLFNWSKKHGDLRVVLFMGVHSLQIIPLLSHFLFEKKRQVVFFSLFYFMLMCMALFFTFLGQSFF
jgi:hypothetical protein